jgi:hypothetical protein
MDGNRLSHMPLAGRLAIVLALVAVGPACARVHHTSAQPGRATDAAAKAGNGGQGPPGETSRAHGASTAGVSGSDRGRSKGQSGSQSAGGGRFIPPGTYAYTSDVNENEARAPYVVDPPVSGVQHVTLSDPLDATIEQYRTDDGAVHITRKRWSEGADHVDDCDWTPDELLLGQPGATSWSNDIMCIPTGRGSPGGTVRQVEHASVTGAQDVVVGSTTMHGVAVHVEGQNVRNWGSSTIKFDFKLDAVIRADGLLLKSTEQDTTVISATSGRTFPVTVKSLTLVSVP